VAVALPEEKVAGAAAAHGRRPNMAVEALSLDDVARAYKSVGSTPKYGLATR
jgi:hypothetical protein